MLQLVTHRPGQQQPAFSFFILNKGMNSGKPLTTACANCFVATCSNENEKEFYYWLCWGLWQAKAFEHFLTGSVIVFIRKKDLLDQLLKQGTHVNQVAYKTTIDHLQTMAQHETNLLQQLQLMKQLKRAMIYRHLQK